jgi:cytochrome c peroxidase
MLVPTDDDVDDLHAYLVSLRPEPNPSLRAGGVLTEAARRGKIVFEGKAECSGCHPGPYFTDLKSHKVGTLDPTEPDAQYDTPALIEAYRTAPYLHDGRARTLREVLTKHNAGDQHGKTTGLTEQEITDLETYLLSL